MVGKLAPWPMRSRLVLFTLGSSVLAIMASASSASAQCAPDPTSINGTTTCSGVDSDGLNVPTSGTRVIVQPGATVFAGSHGAGIATSGSNSTLTIGGSVVGGNRPGVSVTNANSYYGYLGPCDPYAGASVTVCGSPYGYVYPSNATAISIGAAGVVSGSSAIRLQANPNNSAGTLTATIINAGTLSGSAGAALVADTGAFFTQITNQAGGTIGGISGMSRTIVNAGTINGGIVAGTPTGFAPGTVITNSGTINGGISAVIQSIANTGTIDGGATSAIAANTTAVQYVSITNSGRIVSNGSAATLTTPGSAFVQNSGSIVNVGSGSAIQVGSSLTLTNAAGATIGSAGQVAISSGVLSLTNAGTINGSVVSTGTANQYGMVDITAGTINGDLLLGASNDTVAARFDIAAGRIAGVSATIDAGAGIDTLNVSISGDATLAAATIPASFERLGLDLTDATVTLANGIQLPNGVSATGTGTLVNDATLATTGQAIITSAGYPGILSVVNTGSITANLANSYGSAVSVNLGALTNSGTITAVGGSGVSVTNYDGTALTNTGTITASGFGALVYLGPLVNSGTIRSTGNTGAIINGSSLNATPSTNSGLIEGAISGVSLLFGRFVNTGTVIGGVTGTGTGVDITYYGIVNNQAGGTITGATGISGRNGYNSIVLNAGTINGGVNFASGSTYDQSPDVFVDAGGIVNGAVRLGGGDDLFVTDLVQPAERVLGGATGGVDAGDGYDSIVYRVGADETAQIARPSGFEGVGYELANDAALTLTAAGLLANTLMLSGIGKVDLTADITAADRTLIDLTAPTVAQRIGDPDVAANALDVVSRGTLTASTTGDGYFYSQTYAVNAGEGRFENAGTINVTGFASDYYYYHAPLAIVGNGTVVNSGTINLAGLSYGISAPTVVNSGIILGAIGAQTYGVVGAQSVQNSGSIVTDGTAITGAYYAPSQIINTGLIESRQDTALLFYEGADILNDSSGVIRGASQAITAYGSTVVNRGTIVGDVYLGSYPDYSMSSYTADGGTLAGDLTFGEGDDVFVQTGATTGISGLIDGGDGTNAVILQRSGVGSFTGATNFATLAVNAGSWTLTGAQTYAGGTTIAAGATAISTGAVLNGAFANAGALVFDQSIDSGFNGTITGIGSVTKAGTGILTLGTQTYTGATNVTGGTLALTGTLASTTYDVATGATLTSGNAATIGSTLSALSVRNAGTIESTGGAAIALGTGDDLIVNAGRIVGANGVAVDMGAGNDTLALMPGSTIVGRVDGGAGTDQVILGGTGTGSFAGAVNVERLNVASGNWTLSTASSFANGTGIAAGATLTGTTTTLTGGIANAGTLRIDQASNGAFAATLAGTGALVKAGTGNVTIGNQLGFTGTTSIQGGCLTLAGTLPAAVTVQSGGTLGGNGTIASATIASGGTIAPGNSIGTIAIAGNFVQQAGSTYAAEIDAAGRSDLIAVGGTATLQSGAQLALSGTAGGIGTRYTVLTAAGGISGSYTVLQPIGTVAGTEVRLANTGTTLFVDVARSGAGLVALAGTGTANQRAVSPAFAALGVGNAAYRALTLIPDNATVMRAFDLLSGEVHASLRTAMVRDAQFVQGTVLARTLADQPSGLWGTLLANSGDDDGGRNAGAVDRTTLGGVGGFDIDLAGTGAGRLGIAGGYTRTKASVDARASDAKTKTLHLLGYAGRAYGAIRIRAGLGYAWSNARTDRFVAFPGFGDRLRGNYDSNSAHSFAEAGYALLFGDGIVQPFGGLQAFRIHTDGFTETSGATALTLAKRTETFAFATAGLRFDTPIVEGLSARGVTAWQRRIDGSAPSTVARFATGNTTFDIAGAPLSRDAMTAGLDLVWAPAANIRITSSYAGLIGSQGEDSSFKLSASIGF
jgi:autotransporter-associated beta strand protein